jgi:hypothetical protein
MDINNLLNPEGESHMLTETSDRERYQAVNDAIDACEKMDINGRDDIDVVPTDLKTRCELLKATT